MVAPRLLCAVLFAAWALAAEAGVRDMVVVEARGVRIALGQTIDGSAPLALESGQQVTLMAQDGRVFHLRGPSTAAPLPAETPALANVALAVRLMTTQQEARERAGVIRGGAARIPPDPWLIDVGASGVRCLPPGGAATLWRGERANALQPLKIAPADRSWRFEADWPASDERYAVPDAVPLMPRESYLVRLGPREVSLTFVELPRALANDAMRAGYMMEIGCDAQAKSLLARSERAVR